jgi:hypothetical protein
MEDHDLLSTPIDPAAEQGTVSPAAEEASDSSRMATTSSETPSARSAPSALQQSSLLPPWRYLSRRQFLVGASLAAGVVAVGGSVLLIVQATSSSTSGSTNVSTSPTILSTAGPLPPSTPVPASVLQAWRTKQLTVSPTQRFQHHSGTGLVPLGILEPTYPNPYNPYTAHLHLYLLGGELVTNQLFWYVGLESQDGKQFVVKLRVGPVDQPITAFGLQVTQQSTDDIEGGSAEDPQVSVTPRTLYLAMPSLVQHCLVVALTPQPLPADADGISSAWRSVLNQQASIANQLLQFDFDVLHRTPFAQVPTSERTPIQGLIDTSPIRYHSTADGAHYPLITQLVFRYSDQLFSKLVSS